MLIVASVLMALSGCAISTPRPRLSPVDAEIADDLVVLVLTRVILPADWDQVLRMLDEPDGRRNYWNRHDPTTKHPPTL